MLKYFVSNLKLQNKRPNIGGRDQDEVVMNRRVGSMFWSINTRLFIFKALPPNQVVKGKWSLLALFISSTNVEYGFPFNYHVHQTFCTRHDFNLVLHRATQVLSMPLKKSIFTHRKVWHIRQMLQ